MDKGLSCRFSLVNGKFQLTGGGQKAADNVFLITNYLFLRMIYYPDFNPGISWLQQKPVNYLYSYRTLILAKLKFSIEKYASNVTVDKMNILQVTGDKKNYGVYVNFTHTENGIANNDFNVTFV